MNQLFRRLLYLGQRSRFDDDLDTEVQFHLDTRAAELERSGMPAVDARMQARREFGSGARMREDTRSAWQLRWLEDLFADLRYATRSFRRNPGFALTAVACLALGIGANTTIFSIGTEVMFSEPSVKDPVRLVHLRVGGSSHIAMRDYRALRDLRAFDAIAGENEETEANWRDGENSSRVYVVRITDNFFSVTGIPVAIGRGIQPGETDTVVLTHGFWQRRLGGSPDAVGRKLMLDGQPYVIAGILPPDHRTVTGFGFAPEVYAPVKDDRTAVALYARLPDGMTQAEARDRLKAACAELDRVASRGNRKWSDSVMVSGIAGMDRIRFLGIMEAAIFFAMLMVIVALVLLIACANVASLLLARAASRSHELAVRVSIGAGRWRLVRQLLAESLLLALAGAASGLALNVFITRLLSTIRFPLPIPIQFRIEPDWRLMLYAAAVAVLTGVAAGTIPALKASRVALAATLKRERGRWNFRNALVAGQLAVSIVLLSAGVLFVRNLFHATTVSPGFDTTHTIWAYMRLVPGSNPRNTIDEALARLRTLPAVESAAIARVVPLNNNVSSGTDMSTDVSPQKVPIQFKFNSVGADYFRTMQIPIVAGREFLPSDRPGGQAVCIINESMARRLFGNASAIGHTLQFDEQRVQVVGVAKDSKHFMLSEGNESAYYEPYSRMTARNDLHFLIRTKGRPEPLTSSINAVLGQIDATAAIDVKPMSQALTFALLPSQFGAAVLGSMGLLGLVLASIGLYGVLLYSVSRRTREIGLRVALGATPRSILKMVMLHSAVLLAAGLVTGTALAVFAVRPLAMFLIPGVRPADPVNFLIIGAVLSLVAVAATAAPALRALRVDPMVALRQE